MSILIVGYGNSLRSDDGLGPNVVTHLSSLPEIANDSTITVTISHQLVPEMAELIAQNRIVVFIDSRAASPEHPPGSIHWEMIQPDPQKPVTMGHHFTPSGLLSYTNAIFRVQPMAYVASVSAESFDYGDALTPIVKAALPSFVQLLQTKIRSFTLNH